MSRRPWTLDEKNSSKLVEVEVQLLPPPVEKLQKRLKRKKKKKKKRKRALSLLEECSVDLTPTLIPIPAKQHAWMKFNAIRRVVEELHSSCFQKFSFFIAQCAFHLHIPL